ncbi:peptide-methionine (S)-S-oxide reductase [uncultured Dokdonia sp.]|uniref:peptide-methionine (S)-S-oxide reductase n=1 Tax=uncultured Dokdonia sp. TaxID=575653 RepID=UPI0026247C04|nr:peptide-methionine (S)-S-oxide reductase [uncultured Dokdonia sp.]
MLHIKSLERIGFGGGCHWCTEAVFQTIKGVQSVEQGFIASTAPNDSLSEGVIVQYDPQVITLEQLIEVHVHTHKSTSNHSFRTKYRSAMYYYDKVQESAFAKAVFTLQPQFSEPIITKALPLSRFKLNDESFLDYFKRNPDAPFCTRYIHPKLEKLQKEYTDWIKE